MEDWIVILLIISTVLACWSFSFFLRLLSEYVARKRQRLRSEHKRKGVTMALFAMALGLAGSGVAGWFAFDIAQRTSNDNFGDSESVFAVAAGLVLFALMLLIWAIIGDRSRGRLRCPRCWYDMEGIDTPQCPECGKAIKSDRHLRKARRMKWPFALAGLLVGFATYGFVNLERVEETDAFALMPTWVLVLGWEVLPEDWILEDNSPFESSLQGRLDGSWDFNQSGNWIELSRQKRFADRLCRGVFKSKAKRWDLRRNQLLNTVSYAAVVIENPDGSVSGWNPPPIDAAELFRLSTADVLDAWESETPSELDTRITMTSLDGFWNDQPSPYVLARYWIENEVDNNWEFTESDSEEEVSKEQEAYESLLNGTFAAALEPLSERLSDPSFGHWINYWDETVSMNAMIIAHDADVFRLHWRSLLDQTGLDEKRSNFDRSRMLIIYSGQLSDSDVSELYQELYSMLVSDSVTAVNHALDVAYLLQRFNDIEEQFRGQNYQTCAEYVISTFLDDDTQVYPDSDYSSTRRQHALGIYLRHDRTGIDVYPLIREHVMNYPDEYVYLPYIYHPESSDVHLDAWVDNFAGLVNSDDVHVRDWLARNIPVQRGTRHDELIDSIVLQLVDDENEEVAYYASDMVEARSIAILDTQDDE